MQQLEVIADPVQTAAELFHSRYGEQPAFVVRAPGRVNLIGEHTDYNGGLVLPMALERYTVIAARPRPDSRMRVYSQALDREAWADLGATARSAAEPWMDYLVGVADQLQRREIATGAFDAVLVSNVPMGAGLSSSAALEMAALALFEVQAGLRFEVPEAATLGQRVENDFLGLSSGIMDQFAVRGARKGHALFLDCSTLQFEQVPLKLGEYTFVITNTCSPRKLRHSEYNARVAECREALKRLNLRFGRKERSLRGFSAEEFREVETELPDPVVRRARHVFTENERTRLAAEALEQGELETFGHLMVESHESLRDDYEVTSPELNSLFDLARGFEGCLGARMTGAGFGGCTVSLVASDAVASFEQRLRNGYAFAGFGEPEFIVSGAGEGAGAAAVYEDVERQDPAKGVA